MKIEGQNEFQVAVSLDMDWGHIISANFDPFDTWPVH